MNEEEKQAIESLRKNRGVSFAQADIISNLIDKQQKEIEEMQEELQMYVDTNVMKEKLEKEIEELKSQNNEIVKELKPRVRIDDTEYIERNFISKDKIRAKIKEYEKIDKEEYAKQGNFEIEISLLNELLEEK